MFIRHYPITKARPASYNPRKLPADKFAALCDSITQLGIIRPIIVTETDLIVAGHQRTRAMRHCGYESCPAVVIKDAGLVDEIRFNQVHNAADKEETDGTLMVPPYRGEQWVEIPPDDIKELVVPLSGKRRHEIMQLMIVHGNWGSAVANYSGHVIACQLYASAARIMRVPLRVCYVPDAQTALVRSCFGKEYGEFSYDNLPQTPWVQTLAQPMRMRTSKNGSKPPGGSLLYKERILPLITPETKVLDFGAGQMDHANDLKRKGYNIQAVEFFYRKKGSMEIDYPAIMKHIDGLCDALTTQGLFDVTIADAVINSVADNQAESDVLACLSAFCKPNGLCIFSTRNREEYEHGLENHAKTRGNTGVSVYFFDKDGFTAQYLKGVWMKQKFHWRQQFLDLTARHFGERHYYSRHPGYHNMVAINGRPLSEEQLEAAIEREFNLPLPGGHTIKRAQDILAAYRAAKAISLRKHAA